MVQIEIRYPSIPELVANNDTVGLEKFKAWTYVTSINVA